MLATIFVFCSYHFSIKKYFSPSSPWDDDKAALCSPLFEAWFSGILALRRRFQPAGTRLPRRWPASMITVKWTSFFHMFLGMREWNSGSRKIVTSKSSKLINYIMSSYISDFLWRSKMCLDVASHVSVIIWADLVVPVCKHGVGSEFNSRVVGQCHGNETPRHLYFSLLALWYVVHILHNFKQIHSNKLQPYSYSWYRSYHPYLLSMPFNTISTLSPVGWFFTHPARRLKTWSWRIGAVPNKARLRMRDNFWKIQNWHVQSTSVLP